MIPCYRGTSWDVSADRWPPAGSRKPVCARKGGLGAHSRVRGRGWKPTARLGVGHDLVSSHFRRPGTAARQPHRVALNIRQAQRGSPKGLEGTSQCHHRLCRAPHYVDDTDERQYSARRPM